MLLRAWRRPQNNILKYHNYLSQQGKETVNSQNPLQVHIAVINMLFKNYYYFWDSLRGR